MSPHVEIGRPEPMCDQGVHQLLVRETSYRSDRVPAAVSRRQALPHRAPQVIAVDGLGAGPARLVGVGEQTGRARMPMPEGHHVLYGHIRAEGKEHARGWQTDDPHTTADAATVAVSAGEGPHDGASANASDEEREWGENDCGHQCHQRDPEDWQERAIGVLVEVLCLPPDAGELVPGHPGVPLDARPEWRSSHWSIWSIHDVPPSMCFPRDHLISPFVAHCLAAPIAVPMPMSVTDEATAPTTAPAEPTKPPTMAGIL